MGSKKSSGLVAIFIVALVAALGIMAAQGIKSYGNTLEGQDGILAQETCADDALLHVSWDEMLERESPLSPETENGDSAELEAALSDSEREAGSTDLEAQSSYTYKVRPLIAPFNNIIYVETNNPDPTSFRLADRTSKYLASAGNVSNKGVFLPLARNYEDITYENPSTHRVKGGYLFYDYNILSDGGALVLQIKDSSGTFVDTRTQVSCDVMKDAYDYLIDTYANGKTGFFEKMDAIQEGLEEIAFYPPSVRDSNKPNSYRPYPALASSPFPESPLNSHFDMFERSENGLMLSAAYPYTLHSQSFPGTMRVIAQRLSSEATISSGYDHAHISVEYEGKTRWYGGSGNSADSGAPVYTKNIDWTYSFDGSANDWANVHSLKTMYNKLYALSEKAAEDNAEYKAMISGPEIRKTVGAGGWIRVGEEGTSSVSRYAYAAAGPDNGIWVASEAWVDGKFVNRNEYVEYGAKFEDHPTADIIVRNVTYTDIYGKSHTNDVRYQYGINDQWTAGYYYTCMYTYNYMDVPNFPPELKLTRDQVLEMEVDGKPYTPPMSGYIYDGTVKPGTPFETTRVSSVSLPANASVAAGNETTLSMTISPSDATITDAVWTSSDESIAKVDNSGRVTGVSEGRAEITVKTMDGPHVASCELVVTKKVEPKPTPYNPWLPAEAEMYRLYNPHSGEHFYTSSKGERDNVKAAGWSYEGIGWFAPLTGSPVYRLYNKYGGEHHYTMSRGERDSLIRIGWKDEGVGWYSGGTSPLYRQYNPNAFANNHNYTQAVEERNNLLRLGWRDEGIAWYGL